MRDRFEQIAKGEKKVRPRVVLERWKIYAGFSRYWGLQTWRPFPDDKCYITLGKIFVLDHDWRASKSSCYRS